MKKFLALLLTLAMVLALPVFSLAEDAKTLRVGTEAEPIGFDPHTISAVASQRVMEQMYNQLVDLDENLNVIPELALSWEQPDDKTYIFHLRDDVVFHNGRKMTAEDVKYSFERVLDPATGALGNSSSYAGDIETLEVLDDNTIKMTLKAVNAPFLSNLSSRYCSIVCKEVVEANGDLLRADAGTGPYTLGEWLPDNHVTVKAFDQFFGEKPTFAQMEFYVMTDASARLAALRTGTVDLIYADTAMLDLIDNDKNIQTISYRSTNYAGFFMNVTRKPFDDVRVRRAINLALDREEIIDFAYNGQAEISGFVPASMGHWAVDVTKDAGYTQNIEEAKKLLSEAGYPDGFKCTLIVGLLDSLRDMGAVAQQQLAQIGIDVEIQNMENAQYVAKWSAHDFEMMACQNGAGSDPSRGVAFFFTTGASANIQDYSNARVDELCAMAAATTDTAAREAYYHEAIQIILDDAAVAIVASPYEYYLASANLSGYAPTSANPYSMAGVELK